MDSTLFLTILGTVLAVYAVLPEHKKIKAITALGSFELLLIITLIILMVLALIGGIFSSLQNPISFIFGLNEQFIFELLYILFAILILCLFLYSFFNGNIENKKYLLDRIDELLNEQKFAVVLTFIDENYDNIRNIQKNKDKNINNTKDSFVDDSFNKMWLEHFEIEHDGNIKTQMEFNNTFFENLKFKVLNNEFVKQLTILRPLLGLKIIRDDLIDLDSRKRFAKLYFSNLLINNESLLYKELANFSEVSYKKYKSSSNYKILHTVFDDVQFANEISVFKPIGDTVLEILENQNREKFDVYNEYNPRFIDDRELDDPIYMDPVFIGIQFFDVMIKETIYQKSEYHMWLYYYHYFIIQICQNYDDKKVNLKGDFPNIYSYFVYKIVDNLINWIKIPMKSGWDLIPIKETDCETYETIIKEAIICLVRCNKEILQKNKVPISDKKRITMKIFDLYLYLILGPTDDIKKYGKIVSCCLLKEKNENYLSSLKEFWETYDKPSLRGTKHGSKKKEEFERLGQKIEEALKKP